MSRRPRETPAVPDIDLLPDSALLRLAVILRIVPMGRSTFLDHVQKGKIPRPIKIGPRTSAWRVGDIRPLLSGAPQVTADNIDANAAKAVATHVANRRAAKITEAERARRRELLL